MSEIKRHWLAGLALTLSLLAVYLFFYNGVRISNDEIYLFDSAESVARHGDFQRTLTFYLNSPYTIEGVPILDPLYEPLHSLFSAPLVWVAQYLPGIGIMQSAWLFNIVITIATAGLLYAYGILQGYRIVTAWIVALVFGLATGAFPYAMTYFREPLAAFFTLLSVVATLHLRRDFSFRSLAVLVIALLGLALTKLIGLLVVVLIGILLFPRLREWTLRRSTITLGLFALVFAGAVLMALLVVPSRTVWVAFLENLTEPGNMLASLIGYQISPSRSIWLFSPVLVIALWGLWHQDRQFLIALMCLLVLNTLVLAVVHGELWWGGNGWGPRYFVSFLPVIALGLFPVVETLRGTWRIAFVVLATVSIALQMLGTSVFVTDYYDALNTANILPWEGGLWQWQWSQIPQTLALLDFDRLNIAFVQADSAPITVVITAVLGVLALVIVWMWRGDRTRYTVTLVGLVAVTIPLAVGIKLVSVYDDPRYGEGEVVTLVTTLDDAADAGDMVLVQDSNMGLTFMNRFKTSIPIFILPDAPGEVHNPDVPPQYTGDDLVRSVGVSSVIMLNHMALQHDTLWLVMPYGPFNTFTRRPTEHYMSQVYVPVDEIEISQRARAIRFDTNDFERDHLHKEENYLFGESLRLGDVYLLNGSTYQRGEVLPVALFWWLEGEAPERDYTVSVHVSPPETNVPVVQRDTIPQNHFGYTSRWEPDTRYIDQHGLILPETMPPGEYCVNIILYYWEDGVRLNAVNDEGEPVGDVVCVARIEVTA